MFDSGPPRYLRHPSVMDLSGLPVLQALRQDGSGPVIGVRVTNGAKPDAVIRVFSGLGAADGGAPRPAWRELGEIPSGTWLITSQGRQKPPKEILRTLAPQRVLGLARDDRYAAVTAKPLWLSLFRDDRGAVLFGGLDDYTREGFSIRDHIRMHFGTESHGCLTFRTLQGYRQVLRALAAAVPKHVDKDGRAVPADAPGAIVIYGKLVISK